MPRDSDRLLQIFMPPAADGASYSVLSRVTQAPCGECGVGWRDWEAPLHIRWDQSDSVGDFTFLPLAATSLLVSNRVRQALVTQFPSAVNAMLPVVEHESFRIVFRADPGPLWWFRLPWISLATIGWRHLSPSCARCGVDVVLPRGLDVGVEEDVLQGWPCFVIEQVPVTLFIRSQMREMILSHQFTNAGIGETKFRTIRSLHGPSPRRGRSAKRSQYLGIPKVVEAEEAGPSMPETPKLAEPEKTQRQEKELFTVAFREIGIQPRFRVTNQPVRTWCSKCLSGWMQWEPPLQICWSEESDYAADFMSLPSASLLVSDRVKHLLQSEFPELDFSPVVEENVHCIRFRPDPGPYWWLRVPAIVLDTKKLGWEPQGKLCHECGEPTKGYRTVFSPEEIAPQVGPTPPPFFKVAQISGLIFMRADVRALIKRAKFVNGA